MDSFSGTLFPDTPGGLDLASARQDRMPRQKSHMHSSSSMALTAAWFEDNCRLGASQAGGSGVKQGSMDRASRDETGWEPAEKLDRGGSLLVHLVVAEFEVQLVMLVAEPVALAVGIPAI